VPYGRAQGIDRRADGLEILWRKLCQGVTQDILANAVHASE
jgi:hypothetical protein